jgi:S-disulfanyl-L-cysteine oxidoreductase SoxD
MFSRSSIVLATFMSSLTPASASDFGCLATPEEIKLWDIDVRPDGRGLPDGSGTVQAGKSIFADNCAGCHGDGGQGGIKDRLVGGQGTLASDHPIKTVGSFWPYATTCTTISTARCRTRRRDPSATTTIIRSRRIS